MSSEQRRRWSCLEFRCCVCVVDGGLCACACCSGAVIRNTGHMPYGICGSREAEAALCGIGIQWFANIAMPIAYRRMPVGCIASNSTMFCVPRP